MSPPLLARSLSALGSRTSAGRGKASEEQFQATSPLPQRNQNPQITKVQPQYNQNSPPAAYPPRNRVMQHSEISRHHCLPFRIPPQDQHQHSPPQLFSTLPLRLRFRFHPPLPIPHNLQIEALLSDIPILEPPTDCWSHVRIHPCCYRPVRRPSPDLQQSTAVLGTVHLAHGSSTTPCARGGNTRC